MPETTVGGQPQLGLMVDYFQLIFEQELERVLEAKRQMEKVFEESKSRVESELEDLRRLIQATTPVKVDEDSKDTKGKVAESSSSAQIAAPHKSPSNATLTPAKVQIRIDESLGLEIVRMVARRERDLVKLISKRERELVRIISGREEQLLKILHNEVPLPLGNKDGDAPVTAIPAHILDDNTNKKVRTATPAKSPSKKFSDFLSRKSDKKKEERKDSPVTSRHEDEKRARSGSIKDSPSLDRKMRIGNADKSGKGFKSMPEVTASPSSPPGGAKFTNKLLNIIPQPSVKVSDGENWICCLQFDKKRIVSGSLNSRAIQVWDFESGKLLKTLEGHTGIVYCLQFRENKLVSGSGDGTYKVWDLETGRTLATVEAHTPNGVLCLQFDNDILVTGCTFFSIKVWDFKTGQCLRTLKGHEEAVWCLQFDDARIISGSEDRTIKIWDRKNGELLNTLRGHAGPVRCLKFDEEVIVTGSEDCSIRIWDIKTGELLKTLTGHSGTVICLQFDKHKIVSGSFDRTIRVWDRQTWKCVVLRGHRLGIYCLQYNDSMILSGSEDGTILQWT